MTRLNCSLFPLVYPSPILPHIFVTLQWENALPYYNYTDGVIDALNGDARFEAVYATPAIYVAERIATVTKMPVLTGDMFPYNDDSQVRIGRKRGKRCEV